MELEVYDHFFRAEDEHWWFRARRRIIGSVLETAAPGRGLRVADVGCGTGGMMGLLSGFGEVTGVDEAPAAREYCRKRGFERVLTLAEWDRTDDRYDLVTGFDVVEHVDDDVGFLRRLSGRLLPEGRLLVTVPAYPFLWSTFDEMNHHRRRYTRKGLVRAMREAGIRVERTTHFNSILFPPIAVVRGVEKVLKRDPTDPEEKRKALERWFRVGPLNGILEAVFASERHWLRRADLGWGCSILALGSPGGGAG